MKILLIYPPVTFIGRGKVGAHIPMGLMYIASYLKSRGHEIRFIDALAEGCSTGVKIKGGKTRVGLSKNKLKKEIEKFAPDVVGISVMFTAFVNDSFDLAKLVKTVNRKIKVVVGGAHVSIDPKSMIKKGIDFAVMGEGELVMESLLNAISNKTSFKNVDGIVFRQKDQLIQTKRAKLISNLDVLPFPAIDMLDLSKYDHVNVFQMRHFLVPMVTSRGCPNHCLYCSIHAVWEHSWRGRSAANVVDEIEYLMSLGAREVCFQDDSMSVDKARMNQICDEIIRRKIDIKWTTPNGIAHWTLDKKLIHKMKKAGCYRITFGIESGNPEIRRWVGKPFSLTQARELTIEANRVGMWTLATNIIGFPYESKSDIEDTIKFSIGSDVDFALFFRLGPRPGTPVYEIFKKEGWLPKDRFKLFSEEVACETRYFKNNELFDIQHDAYRRFLKARLFSFMNPLRILRKIYNLEDFWYVLRMGIAGIDMAKRLAFEKSGVTSKTFRV